MDLPAWDSRNIQNMNTMVTLFTGSCRKLVENKEFLNWLAAQKFDLAFSHMFDACPMGLIHYAKIPSWIWLSSGALMDFMAYYTGVPSIPSYNPPMMMESSDQMNFLERTKSFIGHALTTFIWTRMFANRETAIFREVLDPKFPHLTEIARSCPLVMVNSNELYEFTRPTLAKVINIGGIGMNFDDAKPLNEELQHIVKSGKSLVVFSFGSVAPVEKMPTSWKSAFMEAFSRFPKTNFIVSYKGTDLEGKTPPNVHLFKWIPQADLLKNPKTVAFITHGGYNGLQEGIIAGVPMMTIALFGDQYRNSKLAERHRFAVNVHKGDVSANTIAEALRRLIEDKSYSLNVKRLSQMVRKKPVSAAHLLVSWAEFAAEFQTLDNLVPAGTKLNFIQYYSIDVLAFLLLVLAVVFFVVFKLLMFIVVKIYALLLAPKKQKQS
ncbi:unnamed protein product [Heligmosomoides polygyrus]|uniref:UDP-glucuronosyltransferase n=1 Tax=Heligmosomoides polygyrus TaxID=6339 RepID=A0A3P7ZWA9_HELPZ|nr:unnamed protein product [Heligmosomoides polygyrus]